MKRVLIAVAVVLVMVGAAGAWVSHKAGQRAPGQFFDSAGVKIFYTDEGPREAEPVVLIHGFGINADIQWRTPGIVAALRKDYRVITLDNRGQGLSDKPHEPEKYGVEMANDVARLLDHLKIAKAHVIGYSMGGFITMRFIASYPDRLLSAMPCGAGWGETNDDNMKMLNGLADSLDSGGGFDLLARRLEPGGKDPSPVKLASMNYFLSQINDKKALAALIRGFQGLTVTEDEIRRNIVPVQAIVGSIDPLRDGVDRMKDVMANLKTVYLDGDDHMVTPHDPRYLVAVKEFLSAHQASTSQTTASEKLSVRATLVPAAAGS